MISHKEIKENQSKCTSCFLCKEDGIEGQKFYSIKRYYCKKLSFAKDLVMTPDQYFGNESIHGPISPTNIEINICDKCFIKEAGECWAFEE